MSSAGARSDEGRATAGAAVWPIFVATFFLTAGGGLVFPLLAQIQDAHGIPTWGLGVISSLFFLGVVVGQLLLAPLADRGRARTLLVAGSAVNVVALLGFGIASELWQFALARALAGLAVGMFLPAARATVVRADPSRAGALLGKMAGTETGGFVFGPVIGTGIFELAGLRAPFLTVAAVLAAVTVFLARRTSGRLGEPEPAPPPLPVPPDTAAARGADTSGGPLASLGLLRYRGVVVAVLLELAVFLPVGIYDSLWARYLADRGGSTMLVGVGLALYGVPFVLWAPFGGRLADRRGAVWAAVVGMCVVVPTTALYGQLAAPLVITAVALVEAVGTATAVPGTQTAMARACPPDRLAAGQGLAGAVSQAGAGLSAAVAAPVYELIGPGGLFGGAAAMMAALVVAAVVLDRWRGGRAVPLGPAATGSPAVPAEVDTPVGALPLGAADLAAPTSVAPDEGRGDDVAR